MTAASVLVVDDSALVREAVSGLLAHAGHRVVTAADPLIARRRIAQARPDVIVLDLEMPREDGLTFLRELAARDPIPVVICSTHSPRGSRVALEALREGAVDVVEKPRLSRRDAADESVTLLLDAVLGAARARVRRVQKTAAAERVPAAPRSAGRSSTGVIALAASTGGPQALAEVLRELPADTPGTLVVQHMPAGFTETFARHLDEECRMSVREAVAGDRVADGVVLIAPGGRHLTLARDALGFVVEVAVGPLVSRHRPSADVLFHSVARIAGARAVGVLMTGMGDDGARGLLEMRQAGAATLAQDEATSVVFGMPREASVRGAVEELLPLGGIAAGITRRVDSWAGIPARHDRRAPEVLD